MIYKKTKQELKNLDKEDFKNGDVIIITGTDYFIKILGSDKWNGETTAEHHFKGTLKAYEMPKFLYNFIF